jgi:tRNA threonylcarbamoyl adenosine modification protein YeaZ
MLRGDRIVAERFETMAKGQAERLIDLLATLLAERDLVFGNLDAVAVGSGPGNFTGIRIAVSAARGLALGLGVPAIGVSAFEVLHAAHGRPGETRHLVSLPHRSGYYLQEMAEGLAVGRPCDVPGADPDHALPRLVDPAATVVLGENAADLAARIERAQERPAGWRAASLNPQDQSAWIARIAASRIAAPGPRPAPIYVRSADAAPPRDPAPLILP